jgi:hypothetical protein
MQSVAGISKLTPIRDRKERIFEAFKADRSECLNQHRGKNTGIPKYRCERACRAKP